MPICSFNKQYRKVIKVLDKGIEGLSVFLDASGLDMAEQGRYSDDILTECYYYKAYKSLKKHMKAAEHIVKYLEKTGYDRPYFESGIVLSEMCMTMAWNCPRYSVKLLEESLANDREIIS